MAGPFALSEEYDLSSSTMNSTPCPGDGVPSCAQPVVLSGGGSRPSMLHAVATAEIAPDGSFDSDVDVGVSSMGMGIQDQILCDLPIDGEYGQAWDRKDTEEEEGEESAEDDVLDRDSVLAVANGHDDGRHVPFSALPLRGRGGGVARRGTKTSRVARRFEMASHPDHEYLPCVGDMVEVKVFAGEQDGWNWCVAVVLEVDAEGKRARYKVTHPVYYEGRVMIEQGVQGWNSITKGFRDLAIDPIDQLEPLWPKNGRYVSKFENETPHTVAKLYGIKCSDIVQHNRARYPNLQRFAKLTEGTVLYLRKAEDDDEQQSVAERVCAPQKRDAAQTSGKYSQGRNLAYADATAGVQAYAQERAPVTAAAAGEEAGPGQELSYSSNASGRSRILNPRVLAALRDGGRVRGGRARGRGRADVMRQAGSGLVESRGVVPGGGREWAGSDLQLPETASKPPCESAGGARIEGGGGGAGDSGGGGAGDSGGGGRGGGKRGWILCSSCGLNHHWNTKCPAMASPLSAVPQPREGSLKRPREGSLQMDGSCLSQRVHVEEGREGQGIGAANNAAHKGAVLEVVEVAPCGGCNVSENGAGTGVRDCENDPLSTSYHVTQMGEEVGVKRGGRAPMPATRISRRIQDGQFEGRRPNGVNGKDEKQRWCDVTSLSRQVQKSERAASGLDVGDLRGTSTEELIAKSREMLACAVGQATVGSCASGAVQRCLTAARRMELAVDFVGLLLGQTATDDVCVGLRRMASLPPQGQGEVVARADGQEEADRTQLALEAPCFALQADGKRPEREGSGRERAAGAPPPATDSDEKEEEATCVWDLVTCESCGSGEREEAIILCDGCDKAYHLECTTPVLDKVPQGNWFCVSCGERAAGAPPPAANGDEKEEEATCVWDLVMCESCGSGEREEAIILCDGCDKAYHLECTTPVLDEVPQGNWFCVSCGERERKAQALREERNRKERERRAREKKAREEESEEERKVRDERERIEHEKQLERDASGRASLRGDLKQMGTRGEMSVKQQPPQRQKGKGRKHSRRHHGSSIGAGRPQGGSDRLAKRAKLEGCCPGAREQPKRSASRASIEGRREGPRLWLAKQVKAAAPPPGHAAAPAGNCAAAAAVGPRLSRRPVLSQGQSRLRHGRREGGRR